jgi:hypothetical protein
MSSNGGEIVKKLIPVFDPPPPPPAWRLDLVTLSRGENAKLSRQTPTAAAQMRRRSGGGGRGGIPCVLNNNGAIFQDASFR